MAAVIEPGTMVNTRLLLDHPAPNSRGMPGDHAVVAADRRVLVLCRQSDLECLSQASMCFGTNVSIAPSNPWIRNAAIRASLPLPIEGENWTPVARRVGTSRLVNRINPRPTIGWIGGQDRDEWPYAPGDLEKLLPTDGSFEVCLLGDPPAQVTGTPERAMPWSIYRSGDVSVQRFLDIVDALVCFPPAHSSDIPDAALFAAMAMAKTVILPHRLSPHFGSLAQYCDIDAIDDTLRRSLVSKDAERQVGSPADVGSFAATLSDGYRDRVRALVPGKRNRQGRRANRSPKVTKPTALLVASNGIGLGHVSRILAITRHVRERFVPVIVSLSRALPDIENFGHQVEYLPSQKMTNADPRLWDRWFSTEIERLADRYGASLIAFDGSNAPFGLVRAVASRADCALVWIRRGMWGDAHTSLLKNSRWFDAIIEPGEIAAAYDTGVTARLSDRVVRVPPIRLLDKRDLISRKAARTELGLDPNRPAALVQIGASAGDDTLTLVSGVIQELRKFSSLQIVLAQWLTGTQCLSLWPGLRVLQGFPISQYFNAFDFSIAEAGYNTFHDVISFELPTVFIPNSSPGRDDHRARARFAQDQGAGFALAADELQDLSEIVEVLMVDRARDMVRANCRKIRQRNGAAQVADELLATLSGRHPRVCGIQKGRNR
ncbi:MAG: glycosyltransferase [Rhodospirillaceae bacterium]|nr:glycosyltransferase [Rhodospirillaceae bacterium]